MSTFGITSAGFVRKRLADIRAEMRADLEAEFGSALNTSSDSVIGQIIDVLAVQLASTWEGLEGVYQAYDPSSAEGVALENLSALFGVFRLGPTPSTGTLTISGANGTVVPEGTRIRAAALDVIVETTDPVTIAGGSTAVPVRTVETGPIVVGAGQTWTLVDSVQGVTGVTNSSAFAQGSDAETDAELRARRLDALQAGGAAVDRAIRGQLLALPGVQQAVVISNRTAATVDGRPPHSVSAVVWPSTADADERRAIAETLVRTVPAGIKAHGSISYFAIDAQGYSDPEPYQYSFASEVDIHVEVDVTTDATYPADGDDQVRSAVVDAVNGLQIGQNVRILALTVAAASVQGVTGATVRVADGSAPGPGDNTDLPIGDTEIARCSGSNVDIV